MNSIDHIVRAHSKVATQYRESANLLGYIAALLSEANDLEAVLRSIAEDRAIDTATGRTLDIIGEIVGQPRALVDAVALGYFGYVGAPGARSYGDEGNAGVGGRYRDEDEPATGDRELDDAEYRLFIRARIARNHSDGTLPSIIEMVKFITGADEVTIQEGRSSLRIGIGKQLTDSERIFLTSGGLIPKAAGIEIDVFYQYIDGDTFAYAGLPNAKGYNAGEYGEAI